MAQRGAGWRSAAVGVQHAVQPACCQLSRIVSLCVTALHCAELHHAEVRLAVTKDAVDHATSSPRTALTSAPSQMSQSLKNVEKNRVLAPAEHEQQHEIAVMGRLDDVWR